jgi:hypothetical protein
VKPNDEWKVLPHGQLTHVAENLFTVVGKLAMPLGETTRRMTVAKLAGGRLAIYSAIALVEAEMHRLEALGTPAVLIVPSAIHRIDAKAWKQRYPALVVVAPPGARDKVAEVVPVDATEIDLGDPHVTVDVVPGTDGGELAMLVRAPHAADRTLVVNDLIFNLPKVPGLAGLGLRLLGFKPGRAAMPTLVRKKLVKDPAAVKRQLEAWAAMDLDRILPAHGAPIDNPRDTLLALAAAA